MGEEPASSAKMDSPTSCWPAVRVNGSRSSKVSRMPPGRRGLGVAFWLASSLRRVAMASWMPKASSKRSRSTPILAWSTELGSWTAVSAGSKGSTPARSTIQSGSVSPRRVGSTISMDSAITQVGSFEEAG